jgi:hypothetical protein
MSPAGKRGDELARAYRRLLWAYPRSYRRVRGLEMLTTLLDSARAGQRRPSVRDVVDIVVGGLACRFRVPPTWSYRVIAAVAAVAVAGFGAWLGAYAGWHRGTSLPTEAEVVAAVTVAVPDAAGRMPSRHKNCGRHCWPNPSDALIVYGDPLQADDTMPALSDPDRPRQAEPAVNRIYLPLTVPHDQMAAIAVQSHDRLAAAGWRVSPVRTHYDMRSFWAVKGDLTLRFEGRGTTQPDYPAVAFVVHHDAPPATLPFAAVGTAAGLVVGWWIAAFAIRRYLLHGRRIQTAMLACSLPALTIAGAPSASTLLATVTSLSSGAGRAQSVLLGTLYNPMLAFAAASLLFCLVVAMAPAPGGGAPPPGSRPEPA